LLNKNYTILHTIIELVHESPRATYKYVLQIKLRPNCFRKTMRLYVWPGLQWIKTRQR